MSDEGGGSRSAEELFHGIFASPPARPDGSAGVEVHSLVSTEHVPLYLFAVKSLAHFWPGFTAVVHDDGTLTPEDTATLRRHVRDVRVVPRATADAAVEERLAHCPLLLEVRRHNVRILQLVDYFLLGGTRKIIGMDSDIVFAGTPTELMRWSADSSERDLFLYSYEQFDHGRGPMGVNWIPEALPSVPHVPEMCCGFMCADRERFFDPDYLEEMMGRTPRDILFRPRHVTQMFYSVLGGRLGDSVRSLGEAYRSGPWEWLPPADRRVLCHYFSSSQADGKTARALDNLGRYAPLFTSVLDRLEGTPRAEARG
ncbi:hypothetical protein [Streptomyces hoynatensis]|uniref:Glycosyl transferase n=1 Tax=Streptomyces hoynatensis TaxID=1141874 RepID=A0A3A9Z8U5_9ACTN|nr:hypothetical protein [Streptomyces hoynatensis]RKN44902.1 hypothetical protein D7294_07280 [Streptomyces hoynatensis]